MIAMCKSMNVIGYFCADYTRRIELIQDMSFETAATRIKSTPDNEFIIVSGADRITTVDACTIKSNLNLDILIVKYPWIANSCCRIAFWL